MDGVHECQGIGLVGHGDGPGDVVDRPQGVGRSADGQELGPVLAQGAFEIIPVELTGLGNHPGLANEDPPLFLERSPGVDVGVMIQLGDDDGITRAEPPADRPADPKGQRGHVRAEGDLVGRGSHEIGQHLPCLGQRQVGLRARGEGPVRVRVVMEQVIGHRLDDHPRNLGSTRAVEIRHGKPLVPPLECRERRADLLDRGHARSL